MTSTSLVVVACGDYYLDAAKNLFASAERFFHPTPVTEHVLLPADDRSWPYPTLMRHRILLTHMPDTTFVYLCDADMLFEGAVGEEILPVWDRGVVAAQHPGYVGKTRPELPYETRPESAACVQPEEGFAYYAGGFFGGRWGAMRDHLLATSTMIQTDLDRGVIPCWHDESVHNRRLIDVPPSRVLSPAYCHPDRDDWYVATVWKHPVSRLLVALEKTAEQRGERAA